MQNTHGRPGDSGIISTHLGDIGLPNRSGTGCGRFDGEDCGDEGTVDPHVRIANEELGLDSGSW